MEPGLDYKPKPGTKVPRPKTREENFDEESLDSVEQA
jgi:hypothetical protein